jgi:hypothetical protein
VKTRKSALRVARNTILAIDAQVEAAGADRTKLKVQIYEALRSKGLDDEAELLMIFDTTMRANMNKPPNISYTFNNSPIAMAN